MEVPFLKVCDHNLLSIVLTLLHMLKLCHAFGMIAL